MVLCAELVGDTVYGYTKGATSSPWTLEAMEQGTLGNVEYKRVNVTGYEDFYPTEMAYDYSTGPCTSSICLGSCTRWIWKPATWI